MARANYYGLILAGGRGTRFWPRSRKRHAKQVLNVTGERSLIQETVDRLAPAIPPERIWILTNDFVRDEIVRQLPAVPQSQIIAEPAQRNTAPAIALAAHILHSIDPKAVFGVFPSDHIIGKPKRYLQFVKAALRAAEKGSIGVLGIQPRWPETGYGYIQFSKGVAAGSLEALKVVSFREKPNLNTAKRFLRAGCYFWNAGMFFWKAETVLEAMRRHQPKTATLISSLPAYSHSDFAAKLAEVFPLCESVSVDYGIIEHADNVVGLACDEFGWNDVGSWNAVYELLPRDSNANAARSELLCAESTGNYIDCGSKLVALLGVKDLIVVDTPDALLVADRSRAQQVGDIVKLLEKNKRDELL
ncbi:MAG TPA: sugar phosphate nucleotidyltransferase [Bryobacteraceae bacterium]|jgi:mannose-1-phosphate guanylyltransferase|nr:sugar phosphate nucleotidyltransferase [Bryobacteraceae bacterium]